MSLPTHCNKCGGILDTGLQCMRRCQEGIISCSNCQTRLLENVHLRKRITELEEECRSQSDVRYALERDVRELTKRAEQAEADNTCDVCLGQPLASGKDCICGNTGKASNAMRAYREQFVKTEAELQKALDELKRVELLAYENTKKHLAENKRLKQEIKRAMDFLHLSSHPNAIDGADMLHQALQGGDKTNDA